MNPDNVYKYIYTGSIFNEDEKLYRKTCFGPFLLTLLGGLTPGGILKGFWPFLSLAMAVVSLACGIAVFVLASDFLTVKEALRLDVITTVAWVFDFSILDIMYFTMLKGFTPWVLLINLPVVLIPLFVGIIIYRALKKPDYNPKATAKSNLKFSARCATVPTWTSLPTQGTPTARVRSSCVFVSAMRWMSKTPLRAS